MEKKTTRKPKKPVKDICSGEMNCRELMIEETVYITQLTSKFENRKPWKAPDPKQVTAIIPGTVTEIFVKKGQKLNAGDPVLILEAMKMRNSVTMPLNGKIKKLNVSSGERVSKGHLMFEVE